MYPRPYLPTLLMLYAAAFIVYRGWIAVRLQRPWWLQALDTLAPWAFGPTLVLPLLGPLFGSAMYWTLALLATGIYAQRYLRFLWSRPPRGECACRFTLMTCNLLKDNADCEGLIQALAQSNADVIALQELKPPLADAIAQGLGALYPYRWLIPGHDDEGMGIISRHPLADCTVRQTDPTAIPTQVVSLSAAGRQLSIINAHTRIPVLQTRRILGLEWPCGLDASERRADLHHLVALAAGLPGDLVLMGDLNLTEEEIDYGIIPESWRNAFRLRGAGPGLTYPVKVDFFGLYIPFPLFRIDHVFCRNEWAIVSAQTTELPGSDHRGLVVEIGWPRRYERASTSAR